MEHPPNKTADLISYFNAKGRYNRFANASLMFGEQLTPSAKKVLQFDTLSEQYIYRKAAHVFSKAEDAPIF